MKQAKFAAATATLALTLAAACGGSSSEDASSGISGTGIAVGIITGFGSIIVNGQHYGTTNATITADGSNIDESQLHIGDYVVVVADINNDGSKDAQSISLEKSVDGFVFSVTPVPGDPRIGDINVMGQLVHVTTNTGLDNFSDLNGLLAGNDCVEVYGLNNSASNAIDATRIEKKAACSEVEIKDFVDSANPAAKTFQITGLTVDYASAQLLGFGDGEPSVGMFVEIKADAASVDIDGATVLASTVEAKSEGINEDINDDDEAEIEGYVGGCPDGDCSSFRVSGVPIQIDGSTRFEPTTFSQADIIDGIKLEAEGAFSGGVLIASSLKFQASDEVRIEATVDEVAGSSIYLLGGSGAGMGIVVSITESTRVELDGGGSVTQGDYVMVSGVETPAGTDAVVATRIEQKSPEADTLLQGIVDAKTTNTSGYELTILGKTVAISTALGATACEGLDDRLLDCSALVDAIVVGQTVVKAEGNWNANDMVLDTASGEVSLED
jgi:hypothetical protein